MNSLIGRLLLLVAVAVLPAIGGAIWGVTQAHQARMHAVRDEARRLVGLVAADQAQVAAGARQLLTALGTLRAMQGPGAGCNAFFGSVLARSPRYLEAATTGPGGAIDCASRGGPEGGGASGAGFPRALAQDGGISTTAGAGGPALIFTEPWHAPGDGGVVVISLSLQWVGARLADLPLPPGASAALLDRNGTILARSSDAAVLRSIGASRAAADLDAPAAILAAAPVGADAAGLSVVVALDRDRALAAATRAGQFDVALLLVGLGVALVITALGTVRLVRTPLRHLQTAALAWARGELSARTGLHRGPREFRRLAVAFDCMAIGLQARESALLGALESTTDSVVVLDRQWRFTYANARARQMLAADAPAGGASGDGHPLIGELLWDAFPASSDTALWHAFHTAMRLGTPRHVEIYAPALRRLLDVHAYPSAEGLTVFLRDVTEQRRAEMLAAEQDTLMRAIAEAIPSLVYVSDVDGRNIYVNRRFLEFSGLESERLLGEGWRSLLHPDEAMRVAAAWRDSVEEERPYEMECRFRAADGSFHWFLARGAPLRGQDGRVELWYGVCTGIDEIIAARQAQARQGEMLERLVAERTAELRAREAQLVQAQKMEAVGQLTGGVAHDFNNLLQAVSGNLELALAALGRGDVGRVRRLLGNAARGIGRGARLTGQLLAFSRRQVLRAECVDPRRLLDDMADLIRRAAGETVSVHTVSAPMLWDCRADPAQLEAAVLNLVINARDAMPEGGSLTLSLVNAPLDDDAAAALEVGPGDYVGVEVRDTGTGMEEDVLARAFEPFFTTKEVGRGSGLGLAQVHGFARQSGGAVRITSRPGQGTVVAMYFPRDATVAEVPPVPAQPPLREGRGATVLLVEDDPDVLDMLQFALIDAGFNVVPARDGSDALSVIHSDKRLDVVLSDVVLPGGISGLEVGREARRVRPDLPVLLTSGYAGEERACRMAEAEFELIAKPCPQAELLARIGAAVGRLQEAVG
jgi:PAS domain S-box-containing protein